jgi:hypothetical protein
MIKENHPTELKLSAYVANNLKPTEKRRIETHLSACDDCRRQVDMVKEIVNDFNKGLVADVPSQSQKKALDLMINNIKKRQDVFSAVIQIGRQGLKLVQSHMEQVLEPLSPSVPASLAFGVEKLQTASAYRDFEIDGLLADVDMDSSLLDDTDDFTSTLTLKEPVGKYDFEISIIPSSEKTFFMVVKVHDVYTGKPVKGLEVVLLKTGKIIVAHKTEPDGGIYFNKLGIELTAGTYEIEAGEAQLKLNVESQT